eukprot:GEMP01032506.1.p1 GENE.GEMP01032506.1~~GEMP01032506.1.p1  ORF type:complete len:214 (+),score=77.40 GEMP01032506.1:131-772(+)
MYLKTVCDQITKSKALTGEDLYKLNEAVFNLSDDEHVDSAFADTIFSCARKCMARYDRGKGDVDDNYVYDLRGLLGTLQNQYFMSKKQNMQLVKWLQETRTESSGTREEKEVNAKLKKRAEELERLLTAVSTVFTFVSGNKGRGKKDGGAQGQSGAGRAESKKKAGSKAGDGKQKAPDGKKGEGEVSESRGNRRRRRGGKEGKVDEKWQKKEE